MTSLKDKNALNLKRDIKKAIEHLQARNIIVHATDTCYGFACDIFNRKALNQLYQLKQMDRKKPVSIMVRSFQEAKKYGHFNKKACELAKKYWPGPLTIVVKRKKILPKFFNPSSNSIGIRIPAHAISISLIKACGPLATTSANISGKPSPYSISAIKKQFSKQKLKPDFYLDSGKIKKNPPSTIIDLSQSQARILRKGLIKIPNVVTQTVSPKK